MLTLNCKLLDCQCGPLIIWYCVNLKVRAHNLDWFILKQIPSPLQLSPKWFCLLNDKTFSCYNYLMLQQSSKDWKSLSYNPYILK